MTITHTNRKGQTYYLCQGTTKTGKPRYYFAREPKDSPVNQIPAGYEVQESVNGIVSLAQTRPRLLSDKEINTIQAAIRKHPKSRHYRVDIKSKQITIYERVGPDLMELATKLVEDYGVRQPSDDLFQRVQAEEHLHSQFTPIMRFILVDDQQRLFQAQRMCFLGSIDDWIDIDSDQSIKDLSAKLIPTLGTDRFFELF